MATSMHRFARQGLVDEANEFFREATISKAKRAANEPDGMQRTPLHLACWAGKVEIIRILLKNRADCMAAAQDGFTPLHFCAQAGCAEGCRLLVEAGAKVNAKLHKNKRTALHLAAAKGHAKAVRFLVEAGADITLQNSKGETPLDLASSDEVKDALFVDVKPGDTGEREPAESGRVPVASRDGDRVVEANVEMRVEAGDSSEASRGESGVVGKGSVLPEASSGEGIGCSNEGSKGEEEEKNEGNDVVQRRRKRAKLGRSTGEKGEKAASNVSLSHLTDEVEDDEFA